MKINSHSDKVINGTEIIDYSSRTINSNNLFSIENRKDSDISVKIDLTPNTSLEYYANMKLLIMNMKFNVL